MNKLNFDIVNFIKNASDFLENGIRAIVFTGSTFLQRIGSKGVKHCEKQARLKRNQIQSNNFHLSNYVFR